MDKFLVKQAIDYRSGSEVRAQILSCISILESIYAKSTNEKFYGDVKQKNKINCQRHTKNSFQKDFGELYLDIDSIATGSQQLTEGLVQIEQNLLKLKKLSKKNRSKVKKAKQILSFMKKHSTKDNPYHLSEI